MKKLLNLLFVALISGALTGCDGLFGGDEEKEDTTLYHNTFSIRGVPEELIQQNDYHIEAVLYVEDSEGEIVAQAPVKDAVDATVQSKCDLKAPYIPGYKFMGWVDDNNSIPEGLGDENIKDGYDFTWNTYGKNATFYATYQLWEYTVHIGNFLKAGQNAGEAAFLDGYKYSIDKGEVLIPDAATTNEHEQFVEWYYYDRTSGQSVYTPITKLPDDFFEEDFAIFAEFASEKFKVKLEFDETKATVEMVDALYTDGSVNPHIEILGNNEWAVEYGYSDFYTAFIVTPVSGIRGLHAYIDDVDDYYHYTEGSEIHYSFRFNQGKDITIRFEFFE